jgi:hypothetical protein
MEDLEEATAYHQQALDLNPPGHPNCHLSLSHLAYTGSISFEQLGTIKDLEESMKQYFEAKTILPLSHPYHATTMSNLASTMLMLFHHSPSSDCALHTISDAFALFESVSHYTASYAQDRFVAACHWVGDARCYQHSSILNAYSTALACLDCCITVTPTVQSWQKILTVYPHSTHLRVYL